MVGAITVVVSPGLEQLIERLKDAEALNEALARKIGVRGVEIMQQEVPKGETMQLWDSVDWEQANGEVHIYAHTPYAHLVINDTKPHEIVAHGRALTFGGRAYKRVQHPGTTGNPFHVRTGDRLSEELVAIGQQAIDEWLG